jgi:putative ATP-dependent endonuclease of OLD family
VKIASLKINGYKRLKDVTICFGDATFLIGPNNAGKSSVLQALQCLLSDKKNLDEACFYSEADDAGGKVVLSQEVILEAEIRDVPEDAAQWRGFRGRIFDYDPMDSGETGKAIFYRKTFPLGKPVVIEIKSKTRTLKPEFLKSKTRKDLIDAGANAEQIVEAFPVEGKVSSSDLVQIDDLWDITDEDIWDRNPGGIGPVVLSKLPSLLLIPAEASASEIDRSSGPLISTLLELFSDVRAQSVNYAEAQRCLDLLAKELDPENRASEFGKMMGELNHVLSGVFADAQLHASVNLSSPETLKPTFSIEMSSNIRTGSAHQGTGMVRAAVFGLLRYRQRWLRQRDGAEQRSLIIAFEEPEIYLHPSAANQMRDLIYDLSTDRTQIVATTHSPYLIDLSRKPRQILNRLYFSNKNALSYAFSVTDEYKKLEADDKDHVKMLLKLDDHVSRIFFTQRVVVVEGDTEEVVLKEAIRRLEPGRRHALVSSTEVIKARGKASIIGLCRYLNALKVEYFVIHDRDEGVEGAEKFNPLIAAAVGNQERVLQIEDCIEDVLGYAPPSAEKPYKAFKHCSQWGESWDAVPENVRAIIARAFAPYAP